MGAVLWQEVAMDGGGHQSIIARHEHVVPPVTNQSDGFLLIG